MVVDTRVPSAGEVVAEIQRLHSLEERGIRRQNVLERSVLGARLPDQDLARVLDDVGVDDPWVRPEIRDVNTFLGQETNDVRDELLARPVDR